MNVISLQIFYLILSPLVAVAIAVVVMYLVLRRKSDKAKKGSYTVTESQEQDASRGEQETSMNEQERLRGDHDPAKSEQRTSRRDKGTETGKRRTARGEQETIDEHERLRGEQGTSRDEHETVRGEQGTSRGLRTARGEPEYVDYAQPQGYWFLSGVRRLIAYFETVFDERPTRAAHTAEMAEEEGVSPRRVRRIVGDAEADVEVAMLPSGGEDQIEEVSEGAEGEGQSEGSFLQRYFSRKRGMERKSEVDRSEAMEM